MLRILLFMIIGFLLYSCSNKEVIYFYSLDKRNCVTIITEDTIRYVIEGKENEQPDTNYVKLNISKVPELGDGVWICWLANNKWDIVVDKSIVIENKLDTSKYIFNTKLPEDNRGITNEKKFREANCVIFDFYTRKLSPDLGAIVEIH